MNIREGNPITLDEVLNQRERRVFKIEELTQIYPNHSIISAKLNIPGPIKNNETILFIFDQLLLELNKIQSVYKDIEADLSTGPEVILVSKLKPKEIKHKMVELEENHVLGRLFDLDVSGINRHDLHLKPRLCLICDREAKDCARSRRHSVDELLDTIEIMVQKGYNR